VGQSVSGIRAIGAAASQWQGSVQFGWNFDHWWQIVISLIDFSPERMPHCPLWLHYDQFDAWLPCTVKYPSADPDAWSDTSRATIPDAGNREFTQVQGVGGSKVSVVFPFFWSTAV
jgi:hypothetical protein